MSEPASSLEGRAVAVTGGGSGIGAATARALAGRGARVGVLDVRGGHAEAVARDVGGLGIACDVADESQVADALTRVERELGPLRGLVTSAGVDEGALLHELDAAVWDHVLGVNLRGTFLCCKHALRAFLAHGQGGAIACVSSPAAFLALPNGTSAYCASKGGVSALVRTIAIDYARHGIRANAVVPGSTETELMWASVPPAEVPAMRETINSEVPLGRLGEPEEVARAAAWLLSDEASYVTGSHLVCDGGIMAKAPVSV